MQKSRSPAALSGALPGARPHGRCRIRVARPPQSGFDRRLALSRLLALWPHELDDESPPARRRILGRLRKALRAERRRGLAGHWTYDLARHIELLRLYRTELAMLSNRLGGANAAITAYHSSERRSS
jgi:hypothetical protein